MKKIGVIIQRYGLEVNGGAEYHARILAEKLSKNHEINIITTTALDSNNWSDYYSVKDNIVNNINLLRFHSETKNAKKFRKARRIILEQTSLQKLLKKLKIYHFFKNLNFFSLDKKKITNWFKEQGPYSPSLIEYLENTKNEYDCYIFFTYLYYPTAIGMPLVADKSIFIPTAHDEPEFYSAAYKDLFSLPKYIIYNTQSEKKLVEKTHSNSAIENTIAGIGIDEYNNEYIDPNFNYDFEYLLYIGRIEGAKGCYELASFFEKSKYSKKLKLIFVGKNNSTLSPSKKIIFTGFVSEQQKYQLLKNCKALIIPSKFESLSLVTLEAMMHHKIVIANEHCEVLKTHITNSNAGFMYSSYGTFENTLKTITDLSDDETDFIGEKGHNYVIENYSWTSILQKFEKAIEFISNKN